VPDHARKSIRNGRGRGLKPGQVWAGQEVHGAYSLMRRLRDGLAGLDGRIGEVKAARSLEEALIADQGGEVSAARAILTRRAVVKTLGAERLEKRMIESGAPLDQHYLCLVNSLRRDLEALGLERREKDALDLRTLLDQAAQDGDGDEAR